MSEPIAVERLPAFCFGLSSRAPSNRTSALEFLRLVAKDLVRASHLAFETRKQQLAEWGEDFSVTAAAAGFALLESAPLRLECVSCGSKVDVQRTADLDASWTPPHNLGCQYDRLRALYASATSAANGTTRPSLQTRRLKAHLRSELASSKATVAREFLFDDDAICLVMARQFLDSGRAFKDAGSLVDKLTELTLGDQSELTPIIEGMADLVQQLTPPPGQSRSAPPGTMTTPHGAQPGPQEPQVREASGSSERNLRRETEALLRRTKCKVCRERELQFVALPCSHFVFCEECQRSSKQCPVCKTDIHSVVRTYTS